MSFTINTNIIPVINRVSALQIANIQIHTDDDLLNKLPAKKVTATPAYNPRQPITPLIAVATPDNGNTASHLRVTQQKLEFHSVKVQETAG